MKKGVTKEVIDQKTGIDDFEADVFNPIKIQEKQKESFCFVTKYKEMIEQYNEKFCRIKEKAFPKNKDFKLIIENSREEILKMKEDFNNFIQKKSVEIIEKINDKMDIDQKILLAEERISFIDNDNINIKPREIDHSKIESEIRGTFDEVKEEEREDYYSSDEGREEEKNNENSKENS